MKLSKQGRARVSHAQIDVEAIRRAVTVGPNYNWRPDKQVALLGALIEAMGGRVGPQPDLASIAAALGLTHQSLYRMLRALETKGVLVRTRQATLEIRLDETG